MRSHRHPELGNREYVVFTDSERRYTDFTDDVTELLGYTREEILCLRIENLSFDKGRVPPLFASYKRDRSQDGEYILQHKNGTPILIHYKAWVFPDGCHAAVWEPEEEWEQLFFAALIETEPARLREKANAALAAIRNRRAAVGSGENSKIQEKLRDASEALRSLLS